jgi:hypothetical protein
MFPELPVGYTPVCSRSFLLTCWLIYLEGNAEILLLLLCASEAALFAVETSKLPLHVMQCN